MSGMDLSLRQLQACLPSAEILGDPGRRMARVCTDSREIRTGDLFVALEGEHFDAAEFLPQVAAAGAAAALCSRAAAARLQASGLSGLLVEDSRVALGQLATAWRRRFKGPLIAVTGSNGKTTVTQMLAAILRVWKGKAALATRGNFNNDIGLPLTLLRLRDEHEVAVVELGMNHPGEIAHLAAMAAPTVALVNNAQREHQEFMRTVAAVAQENGQVFSALQEGGIAVFPAATTFDAIWRQQAAGHEQWCFGERDDGARIHPALAQWDGQAWQLELVLPTGMAHARLALPGAHNVANAMAAASCAVAAGAPLAAVEQGLTEFTAVPGRMQAHTIRLRGRKLRLIDDSYNANPDSVRALVDALATQAAPRLLVLGDMGEVGDAGADFHAEVGRYARDSGIEHLLAYGPLAIHAAMAFGDKHFAELDELIAAVLTRAATCSTVAVKGSRFMHMERVVQALQKHASPLPEASNAL